jgi:hypothetical protein
MADVTQWEVDALQGTAMSLSSLSSSKLSLLAVAAAAAKISSSLQSL